MLFYASCICEITAAYALVIDIHSTGRPPFTPDLIAPTLDTLVQKMRGLNNCMATHPDYPNSVVYCSLQCRNHGDCHKANVSIKSLHPEDQAANFSGIKGKFKKLKHFVGCTWKGECVVPSLQLGLANSTSELRAHILRHVPESQELGHFIGKTILRVFMIYSSHYLNKMIECLENGDLLVQPDAKARILDVDNYPGFINFRRDVLNYHRYLV